MKRLKLKIWQTEWYPVWVIDDSDYSWEIKVTKEQAERIEAAFKEFEVIQRFLRMKARRNENS